MSELIGSPELVPGSTPSPESIPPGAVVTPALSWARATLAEIATVIAIAITVTMESAIFAQTPATVVSLIGSESECRSTRLRTSRCGNLMRAARDSQSAAGRMLDPGGDKLQLNHHLYRRSSRRTDSSGSTSIALRSR